jgi:hypothetical protein
MKDSVKNWIANVIGLIILTINVYMYYWGEEELFSFLAILCVSLALFLFKGTNTKKWLEKAFSKFLSK